MADTKLATQFSKIISLTKKLRSSEDFVESVMTLPEAEDDVARVIGSKLQHYAFAKDGPRDHGWNCLSDSDWRRRLIHSKSADGFRRFLEACIRFQVNADTDNLKFQLPHIFARAAIDDFPDNDNRLAALVDYCVVASIAGGCTSAIQYLGAASDRANSNRY